jgi:hypothetical protein
LQQHCLTECVERRARFSQVSPDEIRGSAQRNSIRVFD